MGNEKRKGLQENLGDVCIDSGFAGFKMVWEEDNKLKQEIFPSITKTEVFNDTMLADTPNFTKDTMLIRFNKKEFLIGNYAIENGSDGGVRDFDPDRYKTEEEIVRVLSGVSLIDPHFNCLVIENLNLGLSIGDFNKKRKKSVEDFYSHSKYNFKIYLNGSWEEKTIYIKKTNCFPQGISAFYDQLIDDQMNIRDLNIMSEEQRFGVIDIGGRTTDIVIAKKGRRTRNTSYSFKKGITDVFQSVATMQNYSDLTETDIEKIHLTKRDKRKGGTVYKADEIIKICDELFEYLVEEIFKEIKRQWNEHLLDLEFIVICGGGEKILKRFFENKFNSIGRDGIPIKKLDGSSDPQFANARGYYKINHLK